MRFVGFEEVFARFHDCCVAIVGSAPSVLENEPGFIDSHEVVVRVNNYKLGDAQGKRTDVHYSFYGNSIRKTPRDLYADGVTLCMCKCPNSKPLSSEWHRVNNKPEGVDFRYIYDLRSSWWFCDTFIPDDERFLAKFRTLENHVPTTGLSAIMDVLEFRPAEVYLTGFDFFASGKHNVDEAWRAGRSDDPIGHRPDLERAWLTANRINFPMMKFDATLTRLLTNGDGRYETPGPRAALDL